MLAMMSLDTVLIKIEWDGEGNIFINDFVEKYQSGYILTSKLPLVPTENIHNSPNHSWRAQVQS